MMIFCVFILSIIFATAANAATCNDGYYISDGQCKICIPGYYCNNDTMYACPDAYTHRRTTFPTNYYDASLSSTYLVQSGIAWESQCLVLSWYKATPGDFFEYAQYNATTRQYDLTTSYGWASVYPGYYLTTRGMCGAYAYYLTVNICNAGSYCPGKSAVDCNPSNQSAVHTESFGNVICPAGYWCPAASSAPVPCGYGYWSDKTGATDSTVCQPCQNAPENAVYIDQAARSPNCAWKCNDGYNLTYNNECKQLCISGITHIYTSTNIIVPLYKAKQTSPAINILFNDTVCYANLQIGTAEHGLHVKYGNNVYHTVE